MHRLYSYQKKVLIVSGAGDMQSAAQKHSPSLQLDLVVRSGCKV